MGMLRQLKLILWKNWLVQKRKVCVTLTEISIPLLFACLLLLLRTVQEVDDITVPTYYDREEIRPNSKSLSFLYAPECPATKNLIAKAKDLITLKNKDLNATFQDFSTEEDALKYFKYNHLKIDLIIVFYGVDNTSSVLPNHTHIAIRPPSDNVNWFTKYSYPFFQQAEPNDDDIRPEYEERDILFVQRIMGEALIHYWTEMASVNLTTYIQRMAYPPYLKDSMIMALQNLLPVIIMLSFITSVVTNTKAMVYEKERKLKVLLKDLTRVYTQMTYLTNRRMAGIDFAKSGVFQPTLYNFIIPGRLLRESMKLIGMQASVYWLSWFITFLIYLIPAILLFVVLLGVDVTSSGRAPLAQTNPFLFFLFLLFYVLALITFCFMVSTFVQKANVGAVVSSLLFFVFNVPYTFIVTDYEEREKSVKLAGCLLFNTAMPLGVKLITMYEGTGEGAQFSNFYKPGTADDNFSLLECMVMLLVDSFIHLLITWYVDNVRPGEFGVPKAFDFPFKKSYWFGEEPQKGNKQNILPAIESDHFETDPSNLHAGIQIENLRKVFRKKEAVAGIRFNMYEGQISVLLGHNGAGKTTTMSMLTGFIPPTSGSAVVNGYDIHTNIEGVRTGLGLCPQHDILFDTLTVQEHLQLFAELKGVPKDRIRTEIYTLAEELGLHMKLSDRTATLSGGQKRKLSVAMALIGGSKVVILDEPSSGMDPAARRQMWTVLQKRREGRTMLLTTHDMDEADVLGDRIAIMVEGVIKCCGTSMFLKKLYGTGYHLVIVKEPSCDIEALTELIQSRISTSVLESVVNMEVTFLLPDNESALFPSLFDDLEAKKSKLGIRSFGTSATTMEEVFLKVGKDTSTDEDLPSQDNETVLELPQDEACENIKSTEEDFMAFNKGFAKVTGILLQMAQIKALIVKKALLTWRNKIIVLLQSLLPMLFLLMALSGEAVDTAASKSPPLNFDLSKFGDTFIPYTPGSNSRKEDVKLADYYAKQFGPEQVIEKVTVSQNISYDNYTIKRANELGTVYYNKKMIIGLEGVRGEDDISLSAIAHYNGQPYHAKPVAINMMMNAFLLYYSDGSYSLQTSIDPLPKAVEENKLSDVSNSGASGQSVGTFLMFAMSILSSAFIYNLLKEKQIGAKHLQTISGVSPFSYWISTFLWDFIALLIPSLLVIVVFVGYSEDAFVADSRWLVLILVFALYGWAILPFTYELSFVFKSPPSGVVGAILLNIVSGFVITVAVSILRIPELGIEDIGYTVNVIAAAIFPSYCLAQILMSIDKNYNSRLMCLPDLPLCDSITSPCCPDQCSEHYLCGTLEESYLSTKLPGIGSYLLLLAMNGLIHSVCVLLTDYEIFTRIWYLLTSVWNEIDQSQTLKYNSDEAEDSDVTEERQRLVALQTDPDPLRLVNITKRYGNCVAVNDICLGVSEEECFGLLGQNGAGKTTIFKMLTGDVRLTSGNAYLKTYDVRKSIKNVQANMGYCPQFDALLDKMTGRETLTMYAQARGIPKSHMPQVVDNLIKVLMLKPYAETLVGNYSGGNKRKLSTAIALVGDPPFIMLDEPSAGMDPKARRQLWNILSQVRASGRTLVLTSHSMEECDALCTRIAIMVNGKFVCLGSPQHLKNKYGQGYTLVMKMKASEDSSPAPLQPTIDFITQNFPGSKIFVESYQGYIHVQIPDVNVSLSKVFSHMEIAKSDFNVQDYTVHQTTLEQIFLSFTRVQHAPKMQKRLCTIM